MAETMSRPGNTRGQPSPERLEDQNSRFNDIAYRLSRQIIEITTKAGSGHPSSSLSAIDILTVLFFGGILRYDPKNPGWPERDRFIMSKGHASPGLYVILAEAGYFDPSMLPSLRQFGSPLEGHPVYGSLPGIEASTGSLGQGLSIGLGHALAGRLDRYDYRTYVMIGDGESDEGQIWEAAMAAAKFRADHLTAILDYNKYQQTGPVSTVMPSLAPVAEKWQAFGWKTFELDGHNHQAVMEAFQQAQAVKGQPQILICHTLKGKGLSPFEKDVEVRKHGVPLTKDEEKIALEELDSRYHATRNERGG